MQPAPTEAGGRPRRVLVAVHRLAGIGPLAGLIALCVLGTLLNRDFATVDNLLNVLTRTSFIGIIAVGMTFVIISGGIDLSVGSMAALIAGTMIWAMNALAGSLGGHGFAPLTIVALGIVLALALGGLFGLAHGLLITKGRIEPFIVTLGTLGIFRSVLTWLADGGALTLQNDLSDLYGPVYYASLFGVPVPVWVFAVVAAGGALILNRTAFGRHVQAIGSNEQVARYAAIRVDRVKCATYVLLGVCVGVATVLYVPRLGSATPTTGLLWELEAIAAVVVGGTALKGGEGRVSGTVVGAVLLSVIANILNLTSIISVYLNAAVQGVAIIAVAFLQRGRR
ncbi:ABC transporter permease [Paraburkholderia caballeronis]|uniref:ABC transporter permease n=1 Tax=Paraburkholderia caballeronis TaxID=416943 RepID=UPI0010668FDA|nr:ABC transporter permease [Paraburkholderia caballeronis]TDV14461.1 monosaccharide ABC transporter membrane protein (CUT2 family) [Paraburkholderia caballeronis]TDV15987.1 monosaccharide ABC transporter membrane protein (CUT2 family) [Paraburkholderia caballeronis]TDV25248.1 monosaccharide ABC transporter membrane protein (CUT2 family) [Paraburkholderia caballeronis]